MYNICLLPLFDQRHRRRVLHRRRPPAGAFGAVADPGLHLVGGAVRSAAGLGLLAVGIAGRRSRRGRDAMGPVRLVDGATHEGGSLK